MLYDVHAGRITTAIPYLIVPDKTEELGHQECQLVQKLLQICWNQQVLMGFLQWIYIQSNPGFFDIPVDNIYATQFYWRNL